MYETKTTSDDEALDENENDPSKPVNVPSVVPLIDTLAPINGSFVEPSTTTPEISDCAVSYTHLTLPTNREV